MTQDSWALAIRASAGTGKTTRLTRWYLDLVERGELPERILATTFTRKAAGEIQSRVFRKLALDVLAKEKSGLDRKSAIAEKMLQTIVANQHRLTILTLDSFFNRIARSFCYELGLQPNWQVADGINADLLQQQALAALMQGESSKRIAEIIRDLSHGAIRQSVTNLLRRYIKRYQMLLRSAPETAWRWHQVISEVSPQEWKEIHSTLQNLDLPRIKDGSKVNANWANAHQKLLQLLNTSSISANEWRKILSTGIVAAVLKGNEDFSRVAISDQVRKAYLPLLTQARAVIGAELSQELSTLYEFIRVFETHYHEAIRRSNSLTFDDLKSVLASAAFRGETEEIYYRLDSRIHHLLLDEFQDTAREQWEIVRPIADEIMAQPGVERSLFVVGDTKQAIYGWRGGVAEIFDQLQEVWPHLENQNLAETYRCSPVVVEAVNSVFSGLKANSALTEYERATTEWLKRYEGHTAHNTTKAGYLRMELLDCDAIDEFEGEVDEYQENASNPIPVIVADRCAEIVAELAESSPSISITILVRRNEAVAQLRHTLQHYGIECSEEGGNPLTDSAAVMIVLALLRLLDHPGDRLAKFHLLNSPLRDHEIVKGLDQDTFTVVSRLRSSLQQRGYGEFLNEIISEDFVAVWNNREQQRLRQLINLGAQFDSRGDNPTTTCNFRNLVQTNRVEDSSAQRVRVMTVHQAKGLEFDAVILPELDCDLVKLRAGEAIVYRSSPVGLPERISPMPDKIERALFPELGEMYLNASTQHVKEQLSLVYVALTRAAHALYLVCGVTSGSTKEPGIKFKSHSWGLLLHNALADWGVDSESRLIERGDARWWKSVSSVDLKHRSESSQNKIRFDSPKVKRLPRLSRISPSSHAEVQNDESITINSDLAASSLRQRARQAGREIHAELARIEWIDSLNQKLSPALEKIVTQSNVREIFMRSYYQKVWKECDDFIVRNELPFSFCKQDETSGLVVGAIDRLVLGLRSGKVISGMVIDFKTDQISEGGYHQSVSRYSGQIALYCEGVGQLFALKASQIQGALVFLRDGVVSMLQELQ